MTKLGPKIVFTEKPLCTVNVKMNWREDNLWFMRYDISSAK
jgi:hypothetical protein